MNDIIGMEHAEIILIPLCFLTATISGVLGMAGGIIFMGGLLMIYPPVEAFFIHSLIQFVSNFQRFLQLRNYALFRPMFAYSLGALLVTLLLQKLHFRPQAHFTYFALSVIALIPSYKNFPKPNFVKFFTAFQSGLLVHGTQILCGVAGPVLDLFFRNATLSRFHVIANKALSQSVSHGLRIILFGGLLSTSAKSQLNEDFFEKLPLPMSVLVPAILATFAGTFFSRKLLEKLSEKSFYKITLHTLQVLAVFYLWQGLNLVLPAL